MIKNQDTTGSNQVIIGNQTQGNDSLLQGQGQQNQAQNQQNQNQSNSQQPVTQSQNQGQTTQPQGQQNQNQGSTQNQTQGQTSSNQIQNQNVNNPTQGHSSGGSFFLPYQESTKTCKCNPISGIDTLNSFDPALLYNKWYPYSVNGTDYNIQ